MAAFDPVLLPPDTVQYTIEDSLSHIDAFREREREEEGRGMRPSCILSLFSFYIAFFFLVLVKKVVLVLGSAVELEQVFTCTINVRGICLSCR